MPTFDGTEGNDRMVGGDRAFQFIGTASFSNAAGELRYEMVDGNTYV